MGEVEKDLKPVKNSNSSDNGDGKGSNDFIVGLVTFIVFIIFMTAWMYFSA